MDIAFYIITGMMAGTFAGLLGVGGGIILIPMLDWMFGFYFPDNVLMHMAIGTSLAIIAFTTASSSYAYNKRKRIEWPIFSRFAPGLVIGAILGSLLGSQISSDNLRIIFAIFLFVVSIQMLYRRSVSVSRTRKSNWMLMLVSLLIGASAVIFGIGGGIMIVPFLLYNNLEMHKAIGTSSICGFALAIVGMISFMLIGQPMMTELNLPAGTVGFVYWPAVFYVGLTSMIFAPIGTRLSVKTPERTLRIIFSIMLMIASIHLFIKSW